MIYLGFNIVTKNINISNNGYCTFKRVVVMRFESVSVIIAKLIEKILSTGWNRKVITLGTETVFICDIRNRVNLEIKGLFN